jgi:cobalamin biosynthesis protein CbiD
MSVTDVATLTAILFTVSVSGFTTVTTAAAAAAAAAAASSSPAIIKQQHVILR